MMRRGAGACLHLSGTGFAPESQGMKRLYPTLFGPDTAFLLAYFMPEIEKFSIMWRWKMMKITMIGTTMNAEPAICSA